MLLGVGHRLPGGGPRRFVRQGQRSEVEHLRLLHQAQIQLVEGDLAVRPRLSGKGKLPVPELIQRHERQRGEHIRAGHNASGFNAEVLQGGGQQLSKGIRAHLPGQGRFGAEFGQGREKIRGRAPRMGGHGWIAKLIGALAGEINEQLAPSDNV